MSDGESPYYAALAVEEDLFSIADTMNRFTPDDRYPIDHNDSDWLAIRIVFTRCCNSSFVHPILPSLLIDEIESGRMEPMGWDDVLGLVASRNEDATPHYTFAALARPCSACLRRTHEASNTMWKSISHSRDFQYTTTHNSRASTEASILSSEGKWSSEEEHKDLASQAPNS